LCLVTCALLCHVWSTLGHWSLVYCFPHEVCVRVHRRKHTQCWTLSLLSISTAPGYLLWSAVRAKCLARCDSLVCSPADPQTAVLQRFSPVPVPRKSLPNGTLRKDVITNTRDRLKEFLTVRCTIVPLSRQQVLHEVDPKGITAAAAPDPEKTLSRLYQATQPPTGALRSLRARDCPWISTAGDRMVGRMPLGSRSGTRTP